MPLWRKPYLALTFQRTLPLAASIATRPRLAERSNSLGPPAFPSSRLEKWAKPQPPRSRSPSSPRKPHSVLSPSPSRCGISICRSVLPVAASSTRQALPQRHVDVLAGQDVVGAAGVGALGMALVGRPLQRPVAVRGVVIDAEGPQLLRAELRLPELAAGVDVAGDEAIQPLDHQPAARDLLGRAVPVTGQHVLVRIAAEPEDAQRKPHGRVVGLDRVGHVAVLVRPVGGAGRGPAADFPAFGLLAGLGQPQHSAVGPHRAIDLFVQRLLAALGRERLADQHQAGEIGRGLESGRIALLHRDPAAVQARRVQQAAEPIDLGAVRIDGHDPQLRVGGQGNQEVAVVDAVAQRVALRHPAAAEDPLGLLDGRRRDQRTIRGPALVAERGPAGAVRAESHDPAFQRHGKEPSAPGQEPQHVPLHALRPGDLGRAAAL